MNDLERKNLLSSHRDDNDHSEDLVSEGIEEDEGVLGEQEKSVNSSTSVINSSSNQNLMSATDHYNAVRKRKELAASRTNNAHISTPTSSSSSSGEEYPDRTSRQNTTSHYERSSEVIEEAPLTKRQQIVWLLSLARQQTFLISISVIGLMICSLINLSLPSFAGKILDSVQQMEQQEGYETLNRLVFIFLGLVAVTTVLTFIRNFSINIAAERIVMKLRKELFSNIVEQEIAFFDETKTGELLNRLFLDTKTLESAVTKHVEALLRHFFEIVGSIAILLYISAKLLFVMLAIVPMVIIVLVIYSRNISGLSKKMQDILAKASDIAQETISNMRTVKSLAVENIQNVQFEKSMEDAYGFSKKLAMGSSILMSGMIFVGCLSLVIVIWYGGRLILQKELSLGSLSSFLIYTLLLAYSMSNISSVYIDILKVIGTTDRIYRLKNRKAKISTMNEMVLREVRGKIELNNIRFSYPTRSEVEVLSNLNLTIKPGEIVALVGPSGSGKSTIVHLIERFYDPLHGIVKLDGVDIKKLSLQWLHETIGIVSQEPVLFATTIGKNIACTMPDATQEQIIEAAKKANAHEFISRLPRRYDTMVGERGLSLSGGQKQRIAIARAFIRDPAILLLDEATSALDSESEMLVQQALDKLMRGKTVLIIAHRLSTVKNADKVCVMKDGIMIDTGTHEELYKKCELYKRLVDIQLLNSAESSLLPKRHSLENDPKSPNSATDTSTTKTDSSFGSPVEF